MTRLKNPSLTFLAQAIEPEGAFAALAANDGHDIPEFGGCDPHGDALAPEGGWIDNLLSESMLALDRFDLDRLEIPDHLASLLARLTTGNDSFALPADGLPWTDVPDKQNATTSNQNTGPEIIVIGTRISLPGGATAARMLILRTRMRPSTAQETKGRRSLRLTVWKPRPLPALV